MSAGCHSDGSGWRRGTGGETAAPGAKGRKGEEGRKKPRSTNSSRALLLPFLPGSFTGDFVPPGPNLSAIEGAQHGADSWQRWGSALLFGSGSTAKHVTKSPLLHRPAAGLAPPPCPCPHPHPCPRPGRLPQSPAPWVQRITRTTCPLELSLSLPA